MVSLKRMLKWDTVIKWLEESKNYWVSTTRSDSKPHARPVWGIWLDNFFYFGGGSKTKTARNLVDNQDICVHTESGQKAVIVEGIAELFEDEKLSQEIGTKYEPKYGIFHPPPFWRVIPKIVYSWDMDDYTNTPTKFVCTLNKSN